jgi:hypothetical protein
MLRDTSTRPVRVLGGLRREGTQVPGHRGDRGRGLIERSHDRATDDAVLHAVFRVALVLGPAGALVDPRASVPDHLGGDGGRGLVRDLAVRTLVRRTLGVRVRALPEHRGSAAEPEGLAHRDPRRERSSEEVGRPARIAVRRRRRPPRSRRTDQEESLARLRRAVVGAVQLPHGAPREALPPLLEDVLLEVAAGARRERAGVGRLEVVERVVREPGHILGYGHARTESVDLREGRRPEVPRIIGAELLAGGAERLAGRRGPEERDGPDLLAPRPDVGLLDIDEARGTERRAGVRVELHVGRVLDPEVPEGKGDTAAACKQLDHAHGTALLIVLAPWRASAPRCGSVARGDAAPCAV